MFVSHEFEEFIDSWTLRFRKKRQEANYVSSKDQLSVNNGIWKIAISCGIFMSVAFAALIKNHYMKEEYYLAFACFLTVVIGDMGVVCEVLIHKFPTLRCLRGIGLSVGIYFSCSFYATRILPAPSLLPGYPIFFYTSPIYVYS